MRRRFRIGITEAPYHTDKQPRRDVGISIVYPTIFLIYAENVLPLFYAQDERGDNLETFIFEDCRKIF